MIAVSRTTSYIHTSSTIFNDEQHKYYQMQINNDEQTGSITWYDIVEREILDPSTFLRQIADWHTCRTYKMIYCGINAANRYVEESFTFLLLMM